jgi:hypothetical protein
MMTPERQLVNPFFTGGGQISVSYPTNTMERLHGRAGSTATAPTCPVAARSSARAGRSTGNCCSTTSASTRRPNSASARSSGACTAAPASSSRSSSTCSHGPVVAAGGDRFPRRPGRARDNATAEVRRSFDPAAGYGPLYQAAYLLGGLQIRGLRTEVVDARLMTHVPRRDSASGQHADGAAAAGRQQSIAADPRHDHRLEVLRRAGQIAAPLRGEGVEKRTVRGSARKCACVCGRESAAGRESHGKSRDSLATIPPKR